MLKKILCAIIAGLTLMQTMAAVGAVDYGAEYKNQPDKVYTQTFYDVTKNHWAFDYIAEMSERGVLAGYPNGNFYPENNVTRAEFAKIMCIAGGVRIDNVSYSEFDDVRSDDWFLPYVEAARYYLSGYDVMGTRMYYPNYNALREDIAVALVKLKGYSTVGADESILKTMFTDWQSISTDGRKYVATALEYGLISGYEDNTFRGQDTITRAEAATLLWRAYQYGNDNKSFDVEETQEQKAEVKEERPADVKKPENSEPVKEEVKEEVKKEKLPYYCDTLVMADVTNSYMLSTYDGKDSIYYYDDTDKCIYKLSLKDKKKTSVFDAGDFEYKDIEITEKKVTKQVPKTIIKTVEKKAEIPEETIADKEAEPADEDEENDASEDEENEEDAPVTETDETEKDEEIVTEEIEETIYETVTETVKEETVKGIYKDFAVEQVYYNQENDTLYIIGIFLKYTRDNYLGEENASFRALFNVTEKNTASVSCKFSFGRYICGNMADGRLIIGSSGIKEYMLLNTDDLSKQYIQSEYWGEKAKIFMKDGSLYKNYNGRLTRYNFSKTNWEELTNALNTDFSGNDKDYVYFWCLYNGKMARSDLNGKISYIEDFDSKNGIEVRDLKDMPNYIDGIEIMYISDKFGYVFYDGNNNCWRNINKQK